MTAPDIKPCPFCGGEAAVWTTDAYSGDSAEHVLGCKSCDIYMPFAGVFNSKVPTQDDVTAWNTRATPLAEALAVPDTFDALIAEARAEAAKAMRKFPQPNYVISKVAEEAGEVVKAAIHAAEGRETLENLRGEIKQTIAMLYRLWVEGDQVHGLPPVDPAALRAIGEGRNG